MSTDNIYITLEIELVFPFKKSAETLIEFCNQWQCNVVYVGTHKETAKIEIPWKKFKKIWGHNPHKGDVEIPEGAEFFMKDIRVVDIRTKGA